MIDLHMHTVFSDGASTPEELVKACLEQKLEAIAVTDHDNTESLVHVQKAAEGTGLEIIPGIEFNTYLGPQEVHVLGYFIDPNDELMLDVIDKHREARVGQMHEFAESLKKIGKVNITYDDIRKQASSEGVMGRPHVAMALIEKGVVSTIGEAFGKYLSRGTKTYVPRHTCTPHEAVEAIYESGGIPVIAHPKEMPGIEDLATDLMNYGLRGLEAYHRSHNPVLIELHCSLAEKLGLIVTGGTDFHGTSDLYPKAYERLHIPRRVVDAFKQEHANRQMSMFKQYL